jgi:tRNA1(Val) A37 N6-methylase TrmN6
VLEAGGIEPWVRAATSILKPDGRLVVVFRAEGLDALVGALGRRYGATAILPIHPRAAIPAIRVLVRTMKGRRANTRILPGLNLHGDEGGAYLPAVDALLRGEQGLAEAHPPWAG